MADVLHDHIYVNIAPGKFRKHARGDDRIIRNITKGNFGFLLRKRRPPDYRFLNTLTFIHDYRPLLIAESRPYMQRNIKFFCYFHRPSMHLGPARGELGTS